MTHDETDRQYNQRLSDHEAFHGATTAYVVSSRSMFIDHMLYEYKLVGANTPTLHEKFMQATRGHRKMQQIKGENVPQVEGGALRDELFVVPGVGMSAADVVRALRRLIKEIHENGMWIGISENGWVLEELDGALKLDEEIA